MKWICSQIGAREHYAIPRALQGTGRLATLYTDFWAGPFFQGLAQICPNHRLRSLAARSHPGLSTNSVYSWNGRTLWQEWRLRGQGRAEAYEQFITVGSAFATSVRDALRLRADLNADTVFFSYDTGALETMEYCRERGVRCVLDQMDPNCVEVDLVREEEQRWPGWAKEPIHVPDSYFRRREQEWALADLVVVNSEFSRQALLKQAVPAKKLVVVPLCFEAGVTSPTPHPKLHPPSPILRVLFLGQVILRKGIQYLMETARLLEQEKISFEVVGPVGISDSAVKSAPKNLTFHGRATRDQTAAWYQQSDVFVLPTLSDGFALTQLEAMAQGLPVVATPNCGLVVTEGVDGFIVPPRNPEALAKAFQRYLTEPALLATQRTAALAKSKQFNLDHLAANLQSLENRLTAL